MTDQQQRVIARLRTYLGDQEAADLIEQMGRQIDWLGNKVDQMREYINGLNNEVRFLNEKHGVLLEQLAERESATVNPAPIMCFTIESVARWLEPQGLTVVSAADAEKIKRCGDCEADKRDAERYRWLNENCLRAVTISAGCIALNDATIDAAMGESK